jgi:hypothetical protein
MPYRSGPERSGELRALTGPGAPRRMRFAYPPYGLRRQLRAEHTSVPFLYRFTCILYLPTKKARFRRAFFGLPYPISLMAVISSLATFWPSP